jgi:hypothetical protein
MKISALFFPAIVAGSKKEDGKKEKCEIFI